MVMSFTMVSFHAHPDDEAILTGGILAKASAEGVRTVIAMATQGEKGRNLPQTTSGFHEAVDLYRIRETRTAALHLGAGRVEFLGYRDSGMMGDPANLDPAAFWNAPVREAALRLASILSDERADVLTIYDEFGTYGHPDHIMVNRVGRRAAELARTPVVIEVTIDPVVFRDAYRQYLTISDGAVESAPPICDIDAPICDILHRRITSRVDVSSHLAAKRAALAAHASQIPPGSFFLHANSEIFDFAFGQEFFIHTNIGSHEAVDRFFGWSTGELNAPSHVRPVADTRSALLSLSGGGKPLQRTIRRRCARS
jgi:LmbE family N-acetylglucosaminyl deacetylase